VERYNLTIVENVGKTHLPLIKCRCGAEILLLPDLNAMNKAIEAHACVHVRTERNPYRAAAEAIRVRDHLIGQMLGKASSMNNEALSF
jgi:hypothetical protein